MELERAIREVGRAPDPEKQKQHLIRLARGLQAKRLIPQAWL
jgi:hypothetical protein